MVIGAIHERHMDARMAETLAKGKAAETGNQDNHVGLIRLRHAGIFIPRLKIATTGFYLVHSVTPRDAVARNSARSRRAAQRIKKTFFARFRRGHAPSQNKKNRGAPEGFQVEAPPSEALMTKI